MSTDLVRETDDNKNGLSHEIIRSEVNFLKFPFFALWNNDVNERAETEYKTAIQRGDKKLEIEWSVSANPKFGYPGPLAKNIHKLIEEKISQLKPPIENPICIGSLYKLAERMNVKTRGGAFYEKIKDALTTIVTTTVQSKGAFYNKDKKKYLSDTFHLYERAVFKGEMLEGGEIAESNYIYLGSWYLENINARYVKPIDYDYYQELSLPIASRLYELLSVKFYGLSSRGGKYIHYRYSTLCDLLPVKRQKYKSWAKKALDPSHKRLKDTLFLSGFSWEDIEGVKGDWYIYYFPGSRAREEIERFREFEVQKPKKLSPPASASSSHADRSAMADSPIPTIKAQEDGKVDEDKDDNLVSGPDELSGDLVYELKKRKVTKFYAERLVDFYSADYIVKKIEMFDYLRDGGKTFKNPAGWLKSAIEDDYEIDDFEEKYNQKKFYEKAEKLREQRIKEVMSDFPDRESWLQERIDKVVSARNELVKNMSSKHPYTDEEISEMREEYREGYPETDSERREWLERQPEYSLSSIEKELMSEEE